MKTIEMPNIFYFARDVLLISFSVWLGGLVGLLFWDNFPDTFWLTPFLNALQLWFMQQAQTMGLPLTAETPAFWYMARAGGILAYFLLWLSVVWGLVLSTKITTDIIPRLLVYGLHEFLSLLAFFFAAIHSLVLLGDSYIKFNIIHLFIPFTAPYQPLWTGLGTVAFYFMAALIVSFYVRKQIGQQVWRLLHYSSFLTYLFILAHTLMVGTDSRYGGMQLFYLMTGLTVLFLTYYRIFTLKWAKA